MNLELISKAEEFEHRKFKFVTTSDRILASREAKALILEINEVYKKTKDTNLMDIMKRLTVVKQRIDKRLKGKPLTA
ncbi:hypothetical protein [Tenacibaculum sp. SG-28]|uniref:hypothetical protein n=1 Tax=Tenacibaculum sp. SG-28 TaxID=754426 RepID=UPI000CF4921C|nr:hypothetical protein [Tenacibaculum sp. SG-28]PQJ21059.1 hypothetical protein BSU00_08550 [Tenacibaculum sp. SG-28]